MRKTIYTCDQCEITIGDQVHISLSCGQNSGIAVPPGYKLKKDDGSNSTYWVITAKLHNRFLHFCGGKCIKDFFDQLMREV